MLSKQSTTLFSYFTFCNVRFLNASFVFYSYVHVHTFMMQIWITHIPFWLCWYFLFSIFERTVHYVITTWTLGISSSEWIMLLDPKYNIKQQFVWRDSWRYVARKYLTLFIIFPFPCNNQSIRQCTSLSSNREHSWNNVHSILWKSDFLLIGPPQIPSFYLHVCKHVLIIYMVKCAHMALSNNQWSNPSIHVIMFC